MTLLNKNKAKETIQVEDNKVKTLAKGIKKGLQIKKTIRPQSSLKFGVRKTNIFGIGKY